MATKAKNYGILVAVEGPEGSGKSTLVTQLAERLRDWYGQDRMVVTMRAPESPFRDLLINHPAAICDGAIETMLFAADRLSQMRRIAEALNNNAVVIMDRFHLSMLALQGYYRRHLTQVQSILATDARLGLTPDLTILLEISQQDAAERLKSRADGNRFDAIFNDPSVDFNRFYEQANALAIAAEKRSCPAKYGNFTKTVKSSTVYQDDQHREQVLKWLVDMIHDPLPLPTFQQRYADALSFSRN